VATNFEAPPKQKPLAQGKRHAGSQLHKRKTEKKKNRLTIYPTGDTYSVFDSCGSLLKCGLASKAAAEKFCQGQNAEVGFWQSPFFSLPNEPNTPGTGFEPQLSEFELAHLATQLALLSEADQPARNFFSEAYRLVQDAHSFLERARAHRKTWSFEELVQKTDEASDKHKKGRTLLGDITTMSGLQEAIRREFDFPESEIIIRKGFLTQPELQTLMRRRTRRRSVSQRDRSILAKA
jgi:hypothetical protein